MNITCPTCSSSYTLPDEKVSGRRTRMKCQRCGGLVTVDGRHLAKPAPAPGAQVPRPAHRAAVGATASQASAAPSQAAHHESTETTALTATAGLRWILAQPSGKRRRVTIDLLMDMYRKQQVEPGSLLWREGMSRWLPPYDVPEIVAALKQHGIPIPGTEQDASFDGEEDEATRVVSSPLRPQDPYELAATESPGYEEEEVTRAFDRSNLASHWGYGPPDLENEATRVFRARDDEPSADGSQLLEAGSGERLDPSFLGSATPPPEEVPETLQSSSLLTAPIALPDGDVSYRAVQHTTISRRPSAPASKRRSLPWVALALVLLGGAAAVYWQRPEWIDDTREQVVARIEPAAQPAAPEAPELPAFDTERASQLLENAALTAQGCKMPDGPQGTGRVHVKFLNNGMTASTELSEPFAKTEVGECLIALFSATRVPQFSGKPVVVSKTFTIE